MKSSFDHCKIHWTTTTCTYFPESCTIYSYLLFCLCSTWTSLFAVLGKETVKSWPPTTCCSCMNAGKKIYHAWWPSSKISLQRKGSNAFTETVHFIHREQMLAKTVLRRGVLTSSELHVYPGENEAAERRSGRQNCEKGSNHNTAAWSYHAHWRRARWRGRLHTFGLQLLSSYIMRKNKLAVLFECPQYW